MPASGSSAVVLALTASGVIDPGLGRSMTASNVALVGSLILRALPVVLLTVPVFFKATSG